MTAWVPATTPKGLPPEATELLKAPHPNVCPRIRTPEHPNIHPNIQHVEALNATQVEFASGSRLIFLAAAVEASTTLGAQMAIAEMWALGQAEQLVVTEVPNPKPCDAETRNQRASGRDRASAMWHGRSSSPQASSPP